jgi:M3 family oligoendopeptidase
MAKETPKFEEWPLKIPHIKPLIKKANALTEAFQKASSGQEAFKAYKKMARFMDKVNDEFTHISVLYSLDTRNATYERGMKVYNEGGPLLIAANLGFAKAFVNSPYRPFLEKKLGTFIFTMYEYQLKSFDGKIVKEAQEENGLMMKYQAAIASAEISFRGGTYNLPQMEKFLTDPDRATRKEAAEAYYGYLETRKDELEGIYGDLVKVRTEEAHKLGYKSYSELAYVRMNRFDYDRPMVEGYRKAILENVTPVASRLVRKQFRRLGLSSPKIYDLGVAFKKGNPVPLGTTEEKIDKAQAMYAKMSPEAASLFRFMKEKHLLFLEAKPGKQSGGYMTYFPVHKCPIIFSNFNGTSGDADVLTHEFGHCFQAYMARNIKIPEYRSPTMESCEIDSMSMEFFAEPYMSYFFADPDKYRYKHLADAIEFLPYGVTVDEFQHWVYDHPEATPAERDEKWHELEELYTPWKVKAEKGCDYLLSGHRWLTQPHIFVNPFYYIDYTLAQVVAFEFFNMDRKNHAKAWKKYVRLCKLGGKYPFQALLKKDGLKSPFEPNVLKKTIRPLVKRLRTYDIDDD